MIKISVICAVYNVEPYLKRCLDSLINQTLKDIEIICIDDCSADNSLKILQEYSSKDARIIIVQLQTNQGAAIARSKGLQLAQGEYLGFVDPDDAVDLNFYQKLYDAAKNNNTDIAKGEHRTINLDGEVNLDYLHKNIRRENSIYHFIYNWQSAIYKADFIKKYNIDFPKDCPKAQDIVFLARIVHKKPSWALVDGVYYHYFRRKDSLNADLIPIEHIQSALRAIGYILDELNSLDMFEEDVNLYIKLYRVRLKVTLYTSFQNNTFEAKLLCAKALIKYSYDCKNIQKLLSKNFMPNIIIKYIKNKNEKELALYLYEHKKDDFAKKYLSWYQRIFSIKNDSRNKYKLFFILGIKISIKKEKFNRIKKYLKNKNLSNF